MYNDCHVFIHPPHSHTSKFQTDDLVPVIISMDGNFRLVRKKSSGSSYHPPHHLGRFFMPIEEVEPFLRATVNAHDEVIMCH